MRCRRERLLDPARLGRGSTLGGWLCWEDCCVERPLVAADSRLPFPFCSDEREPCAPAREDEEEEEEEGEEEEAGGVAADEDGEVDGEPLDAPVNGSDRGWMRLRSTVAVPPADDEDDDDEEDEEEGEGVDKEEAASWTGDRTKGGADEEVVGTTGEPSGPDGEWDRCSGAEADAVMACTAEGVLWRRRCAGDPDASESDCERARELGSGGRGNVLSKPGDTNSAAVCVYDSPPKLLRRRRNLPRSAVEDEGAPGVKEVTPLFVVGGVCGAPRWRWSPPNSNPSCVK